MNVDKHLQTWHWAAPDKKLQVGLTCCCGTHDIKNSTHTVRYYLLEDSILQKVHEFIGF